MGAGELFGVYYPNYILGCSPKAMVRRNLAFANLLSGGGAGLAPVLYGAISDGLGKTDKAFGYSMSFVASLVVLVGTIVLVLTKLPARPRPPRVIQVSA